MRRPPRRRPAAEGARAAAQARRRARRRPRSSSSRRRSTRAEERVASLERQLAEDWGDTALVAEHRDAREELAALIERWEALFENAGA